MASATPAPGLEPGFEPGLQRRASRAGRGVPWLTVFIVLVFGIVFYLVLAPLVMLLFASLRSTEAALPFEPSAAWTLRNFLAIYTDASTYRLLWNTFVFSGGSLLFGFTVSMILTWLVERTNLPFRNFCFAAIIVPLGVPGILSAISWTLLLSPSNGIVNVALRSLLGLSGRGPIDIYTLGGMCFVEGLRVVPTTLLMMSGSFRSMDPSLEEQSAVAGEGMFGTLRKVTIPLLRPAVLAALIFYGIVTLEAFDVPGILGPTAGVPVFSTQIYFAAHPVSGLPDYGTASALAMVALLIALLLIAVYRRVTASAERFATVTGRGYRPRRVDLGPWRWPAFAFVALYVFVAAVLPFLVLVWGSLQPFFTVPSWKALQNVSLAGYARALAYPGVLESVWNTLVMSVAAASATMALVSVVAWIVVRSRVAGRSALDFLSFLPQAIPTVVLGLALIFVYLWLPIPIYGTIWIIALALLTKYMAFGSRTMNAAFMQIHPELEEASRLAGASWLMTFREVTLPLLAPSVINGWVWVVVHAAREVSASLMLYTPSSIVLSAMIWSMWQQGRIAETTALGVLLVLVLGGLVFFGRFYAVSRTREFG